MITSNVNTGNVCIVGLGLGNVSAFENRNYKKLRIGPVISTFYDFVFEFKCTTLISVSNKLPSLDSFERPQLIQLLIL